MSIDVTFDESPAPSKRRTAGSGYSTPAPTQQDRHSSDPLAPEDLLNLARYLDDDERRRLDAVQEFAQHHIRPRVGQLWNTEQVPFDLLEQLGEMGMGELTLDNSSLLFQGLAHAVIARADLSISAILGIHNELIMGSIQRFGSAEQQRQWLPSLRSLRAFGAFGLTEPEHGSDIASGLGTTATLKNGRWRLQGSKRWIGMATVADIALIWARDTHDSQVKAFLVPTTTPGFDATAIKNKTGLRIIPNADIDIDLEVPETAIMPGAHSFRDTSTMLCSSRAWVGWQAVGAQQALLEVIGAYVKSRQQFGQPLAAFQLTQVSLAKIAGNLAASESMMAELTQHQDAGNLTMLRASLAKATLTGLARESAAAARELMGGNGLLSDHEIAKIAADIEAIHTYEGTHTVNLLIAGREMTGLSAFS